MDVVEQIEAVLDRATQDFDGRDDIMQRAADEIKRLRALAERAGGVMVETHGLVQALSRLAGSRCADGTSSMVSSKDRETIISVCHDLIVASKALTTEPAAPEGRQEAVAWRFRWPKNDGSLESWTYTDDKEHAVSLAADDGEVEPLYTRPAEQAVTYEMVNAAYNEGKSRSMTGMPNDFRAVVHAAIKAAMEEGR